MLVVMMPINFVIGIFFNDDHRCFGKTRRTCLTLPMIDNGSLSEVYTISEFSSRRSQRNDDVQWNVHNPDM